MKSKHTDEQLSWLRGHLTEYEARAGGNVRGDAKKFALEKAVKYIEKWGVPEGEKETTMKEQIYTWFKNTSARGKEARKRHQLMKKAERPSTAFLTVPNLEHPGQPNASSSQLRYQAQPQPQHYPPPIQQNTQYTSSPPILSVYSSAIRDSIVNPTVEADAVSTAMQLCPDMPNIIAGVYAAAVLVTTTPHPDLIDPVQHVMHRYSGAISQWPRAMAFGGFVGPRAGQQLLHHAIRRNATWVAHTPFMHHTHDMQEELTRVTLDRQRKRDHVLWARIHAASLELGLVENTWLAETIVNDSLWEEEEAEWVAGCVLLKGLVRSSKHPTAISQFGSWTDFMVRYQNKWKDLRDEGRQTLMAETLLEIRKSLEGHVHM